MSWPFNFFLQNQSNPFFSFPFSNYQNIQNNHQSQQQFTSSLNNYMFNAQYNLNLFLNQNSENLSLLHRNNNLLENQYKLSRYREIIQIQSRSNEDKNVLSESKQKKQQGQINKQQCLQERKVRFRRRRRYNKPKNLISHNCSLRNDTKNIPKNYGKAMLSFIQKNPKLVKELLQKFQIQYLQFMMLVKKYKGKINTIHDLREMWGENDKNDKNKKCLRILSYHFMRKKCLPYIFNSRVKNYTTHIKYRKKIMEGIQKPEMFTNIKQF